MDYFRRDYLKGSFTTLEKLLGKSMHQMEMLLGFNHGRFERGVAIYGATAVPAFNDFEFASTTFWNTNTGVKNMTGLNSKDEMKQKYLHLLATLPNKRLIKVVPAKNINHALPFMYPPGGEGGVNQIKILKEIPCELLAVLTYYPNAVFSIGRFQLPRGMKIR